jgi:tetratricopeptide (TPR) repeat protein
MKKKVKSRPAQPVKAVKAKAKPPAKPAKVAAKPAPKPAPKKAAPQKPAPKPKRPAPPPPPSPAQILAEKLQQLYEEAIRLFYSQKYDRANALFQKIMQGPDRTLAHHAQVHANICAARLQRQPEVPLRTVEDHYNYAVTMMNVRKLEEATQHLETALRLAPQADHIHYALAATQALRGNPEGAYQRLKTAIELEPGNRQRARADADFLGIMGYPPVVALLHLDR